MPQQLHGFLAGPPLEACPAGQSPPGDASPHGGEPRRSPGRARLALEKLSQSLKLHRSKWLSMAGAAEEPVVGQYYDPSKNQLPYGGATDLQGRIVWAVTKEEHDKMLDRINRLFPE